MTTRQKSAQRRGWGWYDIFLDGTLKNVDVHSSSFPHWDRNPNTGQPFGESTISDLETATQTVFHDAARPSHISLPVIPR
jgi:uncharacterized protein